jgi:hypothetical protein
VQLQDSARPSPYLSVVLTAREHEDDPESERVDRLRRFIGCFDEQCRRAGLDAEVVIVDWHHSPHQDSVAVPLPDPCFCTYRFIEVPCEIHRARRHADVLSVFPMIARNVGVRRARGRFVLATDAGVMCSTQLIEHLATHPLQAGRIYRADRRDVDADVPVGVPLEIVMAYCATHQRRVHTRLGSEAVDRNGAIASVEDDIVDGRTLRLGAGWHVRQSDARTGVFRWARERADLIVDAAAAQTRVPALEIDVEVNPDDARAWVALEVLDDERVLSRTHVTGRMQLHVRLEHATPGALSRIVLRAADTYANARFHLPVFERRDQMCYRVRSASVREAVADPSMRAYPLAGWINANPTSTQTVTATAEGLSVATEPLKWSYSMQYGMLIAPARGSYRFELSCTVREGRVMVGVLNGSRNGWIPASVAVRQEAHTTRFTISVDASRLERFWLMIYNDHPDGAGISQFIVRGMTGSCAPARLAVTGTSRALAHPMIRWATTAVTSAVDGAARVLAIGFSPARWRARLSVFADAAADMVVPRLPEGMRGRIVRRAPEYGSVHRAFQMASDRTRALAPLEDFSSLAASLRHHRPPNLHVNHCGDFQLMAREHWHDLRGYAEFAAWPQNLDALLSFVANAAGLEEEVLAMPIYRPLPKPRSGAPPEDDAVLQRRMAQRVVPTVDPVAVSIWASQMQWLQRPILFNDADWGLGAVELRERTVLPAMGSAS